MKLHAILTRALLQSKQLMADLGYVEDDDRGQIRKTVRSVNKALIAIGVKTGKDGHPIRFRKEWVPCAKDGAGAWCWFDQDDKPYGTKKPRRPS